MKKLKNTIISTNQLLLTLTLAMLILGSSALAKPARKVLVFSKTATFRHTAGIAAGTKAIQQLGTENKFAVDQTEDAQAFTPDNLKQYAAVIFLSTTGDVLNDQQQQAFEGYIKNGGGFVGIHASADTEYDWPWYGELNGAYFENHPKGQQEATFKIINKDNISTRHLPAVWKRTDELYNFKWIAEGLHVLITIDETSYTGGKNGDFHPMSWYRNYAGGRAFYTALGHDEKSFADSLYLKHLLGGIEYAMGTKPQAKLKS
ncbi:MAG: ThuA protein [Adhaeribacter sp.]|nr:ThuA protein [Adhaeribacter sp.]